MQMSKISVVVPVYRGESTIVPLVERISDVLGNGYLWEAILVFDNGHDNSWDRIKELCARYPDRVSGYRLSRNYGQQRALMFGLSKASGDFIVTMDEDLQHDPAGIHLLLDAIVSEGYDVVYGKFGRLEQNIPRKIFSKLLRRILITFLPHLYRDYSPYRIIRSDTLQKIIGMNGTITFIDDYLSRVTANSGFVRVNHSRRPSGKSSYSVSGLFGLALSAILAYSYIVPVLLFTGAGIIAASLLVSPLHGRGTIYMVTGGIVLAMGLAGLAVNLVNRGNNLRKVELSESIESGEAKG